MSKSNGASPMKQNGKPLHTAETLLNGETLPLNGETHPRNGGGDAATKKTANFDKHDLERNVADLENVEDSPPLPPDGGYGWMIMFASFMVNMIVDGVCFSFGIFYLEFLDYYQESKAKTSWVGSVLNGMYLTMGPIVSALANKFGCRTVTIAGSIIATAAYILSTFSPNIDVLILTYGALGGFGFGLMYLPAIVMVGFYFEKRRAFATGVAVCGSGIGAFVFAPLCEYLLSVYGWQGATWVVAGLVLNGVVMGALFRPLEAEMRASRAAPAPCTLDFEVDADEVTGPTQKELSPVKAADPKALIYAKMKDNVNKELAQGGNLQSQCIRSCHDLSQSKWDKMESALISKSVNDLTCTETPDVADAHNPDLDRPMYRKDIFYSGSVHNLPEFKKSNQDMGSYVRSVTSIPRDIPESKKGALWECLRWFKSMTDTLREMMDFSLLRNPVFCLYGLSCFLCMTAQWVVNGGMYGLQSASMLLHPPLPPAELYILWFFVPFTFLPAHALDQNCTMNQSAFLLSIIGIANTVARVLAGWVSDQTWGDPIIINNCALIIGGAATIACPFCNSYGLLAAYSTIFGACIAAFVSLRSIIMVELMGLDKLTNAFGLVTMCQGLSAFIGAPIAGALYDATGDYTYSFYMAGGTLGMAGIICIPLRRMSIWYNNKNNNAEMRPATTQQLIEKPLKQNVTEQSTAAKCTAPVEL